MRNVFIATSREVGKKCIEWAKDNMPINFCLIEGMEKADIIISVLYDKIIALDILSGKSCFNFHPGVLPEYRGAGAFSWVLINEEKKVGATLHLMDRGIDTGDIIEVREFLIAKNDTAHTLFLKGQKLIFKMFKDWFHDLLNEDYVAVSQNLKDGNTYLRRDLQKAKNLTKYIKAFHFPGKESAYYFNSSGEKKYIKLKG